MVFHNAQCLVFSCCTSFSLKSTVRSLLLLLVDDDAGCLHFVYYADAVRYLTDSHSYAKYVLDISGWLKLTVRVTIKRRSGTSLSGEISYVYGYLLNLCWFINWNWNTVSRNKHEFFFHILSFFISLFYMRSYIHIARILEVSKE